jgi:hypothetical protein
MIIIPANGPPRIDSNGAYVSMVESLLDIAMLPSPYICF